MEGKAGNTARVIAENPAESTGAKKDSTGSIQDSVIRATKNL